MSDLINRQAVIDTLKDMYQVAEKWGQEASDDIVKARAESCMASLVEMKLRIENLPPAQPEHKVGKWRHYEGELSCSVCGSAFDDDIMDFTGDELPKCCPDCGSFNGGK